jgi:hypothetical protein
MYRAGKWTVAFAVVALGAAWAGLVLIAQEPKPLPLPDEKNAKDAKSVDLSGLRDAVVTASKRGENVDEIRAALDALEKAKPTAKAERVPPELQALRDAVDAAARKGENVEAIAKELLTVEMLVAGKSLAKPKPEPKPDPAFPNPGFPNPNPFQFPNVPFPPVPANPGLGRGGIDIESFNKMMELRKKASDLFLKAQRDPEARKERERLLQEADELLRKVMAGAGLPANPDVGRLPLADRARLGIRMEHVPAIAAEQLGLEPNTGIAIAAVTPNSAADKGGLKAHDIILEFAGKVVTSNTEEFIRRVNEVKVGEKVDFVVLRKGKKVDIKGVELPEPVRRPALPRVQPFPALPVPGALPELPDGRPALPPIDRALELPLPGAFAKPPALPAGFNSVSSTKTDTEFTLTAAKPGIKYAVSGTFDVDGTPSVSKVVLERNGREQTFGANAKLPADVQTDVDALLKAVDLIR